MITLTRTYFKYKNIIDGEHLAKGVDIIELFTKLPFARCLNFLENYWLIKAIEANPDTEIEIDLPKQTITLLATSEQESFEINDEALYIAFSTLMELTGKLR